MVNRSMKKRRIEEERERSQRSKERWGDERINQKSPNNQHTASKREK